MPFQRQALEQRQLRPPDVQRAAQPSAELEAPASELRRAVQVAVASAAQVQPLALAELVAEELPPSVAVAEAVELADGLEPAARRLRPARKRQVRRY